jgi:hypothetical protein
MKNMKGYQILSKSFILVFIIVSLNAESQSTDYPPPACISYDNLSLAICPPEPLPDPPVELLSYNIYANDVFIDNISASFPFDTAIYMFEESQLIPGFNNFCVTAVYNDWISDPACDADTVIYGTEMPFSEDWISGEFGTNGWTMEGSHWVVDTNQGNPAPAAVFNGQPEINNYNESLFSNYFRADSMSIEGIYIEYDVKLESINNTGSEYLKLELWDWRDHEWHYGSTFSNDNGSFGWTHYKKRIYNLALGKVFRIRFRVDGTNSGDISKWSIDNIKLYRECEAPEYLTVEKIPDNSRKLNWYGLVWFSPEYPLNWDDGQNSGNSIGTGGAVEFDVAARWTPDQLAYYSGNLIAEVGFFPAEANANYSIRVWEGDSATELIVDQPVMFPVIGQWNTIVLDELIPLDVTRELWVGYHVEAQTGYPAGVDDGPAINGYGNMMNFGGWKTLLQINPELDYNWNIFFYLIYKYYDSNLRSVNIYRQENFNGEFYWLDSTNNFLQYKDQNTVEGYTYCYKTNAVYSNGFDNCISPFSNEDCDPVLPGIEENPGNQFNISIYPCPASEFIRINCEIPIKQIEIYNSLGENVFAERCFEKEKVIPLSNLPAGLYFIMIKTNESVETRKIIVFR